MGATSVAPFSAESYIYMNMKYLKHLKVVLLHKWYVGTECFRCGLYWQGIVHDLSKFSPTEFVESAKYFQGDSSPTIASHEANGYSKAWLHHKGRNKNHWEYWTDFYDGEAKPIEIPMRYIAEMACDMVGAGKAYNQEPAWDYGEPLKYFREYGDHWLMTDRVRWWLEYYLVSYKNNGKVAWSKTFEMV